MQHESTTLSFQRFKLDHIFFQVVCSGSKRRKSWKAKIFFNVLTEKNDKHLLLSSNLKNEQILLQHIVSEVIRLIGSHLFKVLCFGFYFHFQILNVLLVLSRSLQVFTHFKSLWCLVATL